MSAEYFAAHTDEANLFQLLQVVGKRGSRDSKFFLDFSSDHAGRMGGKQEPENLEAGLSAKGGKAVGGAGDQEWIGFFHISIVAEL